MLARSERGTVRWVPPVARTMLVMLLASGAAGCGSLPRNPVPMEQMTAVEVPGMGQVRALGLEASGAFQDDVIQSVRDQDENADCSAQYGRGHYCILVLSGGGGYGAFGAGFINGWTETGKRPNFKMVTGISTGSLIAPFAFLGPAYDEELKQAFTNIRGDKDIYLTRGFLSAITSESFAETRPLAGLIERHVDEDMLAAVAREHARGRRLYVGTTNMDAQRFVVWNMGAIANSGDSRALDLFRKILLASASLPIVFNPVMIEVEIDGARYDEMHADGGISKQFFFPGDVIDLQATFKAGLALDHEPPEQFHLFIIRNAKFQPEPQQVERNLMEITSRSVSSMTQSMGLADLYRLYAIANARGVDFNYVEVPTDFEWQAEDEFDQAEMNRLYDVAYRLAREGIAWQEVPPGTFAQNLQPRK